MGKGSSSKRKSSKKKSNKISSQVLKKKSRRKESKKRDRPSDSVSLYSKCTSSSTSEVDYRSRKKKSKSLRRRGHSVSSYSDDSMSPASDSLSTHVNSYKRGKAQHRSPITLKNRKKRARKRLDSPDNKAESRKRKRLSRDHHVVKPRKKSLKKSSKKHLTSSLSSDSESCSTRHGRSSSSTADGERQRSKVMLDEKIERPRVWETHKTRRKRKRSPSSSSCGRYSDHGISVGALAARNNSRRLRSVIAIADQPQEERENRWEKDPHKEEIVYDHDDYPSPKSLDSNEGGCKKESDNQSHGASNKRIFVENVKCEEVTEPVKSENNGSDQYNACDSQSDEVHTNNFDNEKETGVSVTVAALDGDGNGVGFDLESILRQKALENLRRFQGGLQAGQRTTSNLDIKSENINESSTRKADIIQNQSTKQDSNSAREMDQRSKRILERDFSQITKVRNDSDGEHSEKESGIAKQTATHPPNEAAFLAYKEKEKFATAPAVFAKSLSISDTNQGAGFTNACSSSTTEPISYVQPISEEHSLKEQKNEAKDGSEFEKKTMSVMRGGDMVQVSYKVYIPKRAPALARRQLKR